MKTKHIKLRCPQCGTPQTPAPMMNVATSILDRRCRRCGTDWRVVVRPLVVILDGAVHRAEWTAK